MNAHALKRLRSRLQSDTPVYGLWVTLDAPSVTEIAVAMGLDWVVIDAEHGHLDLGDVVAHVRAAVRSDTVVLVRVAELNAGLIKRVLDIGSDGVVVPWIETAQQLREAVRCAHYPPAGKRGIGAERATCWGQCFSDHVQEAEEQLLVVPIIESVEGGRNIRQLVSVDGVDLFFFGPADFSATAGHPGQWEGPGVAEAIARARDTIRQAGKQCGVVCTDRENLELRRDQGFRMLGLGLDAGLLIRQIREMMAPSGRSGAMQPSLSPADDAPPPPAAPLRRPPEEMRPDRPEVMNEPGSGPVVELAPGVRFECLVGSHNGARNLTTGIVTLESGATLPYHMHTFSETVTPIVGSVELEVEGRIYRLGPYDNITVPRGLKHMAANRSTRPCRLHIAMASDQPSRELVDIPSSRRRMPDDSNGMPGAEHVTRIATVESYVAGPNTQFVDYFNAKMLPGLEMSGGYARFAQGGRLPAHIHDFDESITIVEGDATCIVEGRRYAQSNCSTALQPRGRVHYFINENPEQMAMIWVYAGPLPERIVVDERCATFEGDPWKDQKEVVA